MVAMAPYTALLPAFVEEQFDRGVGSYGTLFTLQSLGMAIEALRSARRTRPGGASSSCTCSSPPMTSA